MDDYQEKDNTLRNQLLTFGVITVLLLTGVYILMPESESESKLPFKYFSNSKTLITDSYFIDLDNAKTEAWQYEAALAFVPAIMGENIFGGSKFKPIVFSTTPEVPSNVKKYPDLKPTIKISKLGKNANDASIDIATEFWSDINTIIIAEDYINALLVTNLAVKRNLPIIIDGSGTKKFIEKEGIKSAITVGNVRDYNNIGIKHLEDQTEIWEENLKVLEENNEQCEYIIVTNPYDIDNRNSEFYIPGLSLASSILAAGHNGLIITNNYKVNLTWIQNLGYGLGDAGSGERGSNQDFINESKELEIQKNIIKKAIQLDNDIDKVYQFLKKNEHTPKYLALVGGPVAVPMMYMKSPIWYEDVAQEEKGEEYLATDMFYGDIDIELGTEGNLDNNFDYKNDELYDQELAVGRIVAQDLCDATTLVSRSLGYKEYEYIDDSNGLLDWKRRAVIVTSLMCGDSDNLAANNQKEIFIENFMVPEQYNPDRIATTENIEGMDVKSQMEIANGIIYDGHGYPDGWYHMWASTGDEEADWDRIGAEDINDLTIHSVPVFGACCLSSALDWPLVGENGSNEKIMTPENCMSLAFIHAGAICYIGATEESWGAFFGGLLDEDIDRYGLGDFDLPTMFWDVLLQGEKIGPALNKAKEKFLEEVWTSNENKPFAHLCVLETVLYGDPAAPNSNPGFLSF